MHRQEQEVGHPHQGDRRLVRLVADEPHERIAARRFLVARRRRAGEDDLETGTPLRPAREQAVDRLEQVDVRARQDVDAAHLAAEEPAHSRAPLLSPELRVQGAGVDDAEDVVAALGRVAGEVGAVEPVRDRRDGRRRFAEQRPDPRGGLRRVRHDGSRGPEQPPHPHQLAPPVERARIDGHLVESPRVAKVGDPQTTVRARQAVRRPCAHERRHRRDDHVRPADSAADDLCTLNPPARPRRRDVGPALQTGAPAWVRVGLSGVDATDLDIPELAEERLVERRPPAPESRRPSHHGHRAAELGQVLRKLERALGPAAPERREVVREQQRPHHEASARSSTREWTTTAGAPTATAYAGTSASTTELAPTTAPRPTRTPGPIKTFWPIHAPSPISTGRTRSIPWSSTARSTSPNACEWSDT